MECDRSFGLIEKKKRLFPQVFVSTQWQEVIKNSSTKFHVYNMATEDFYSFSTLDNIMNEPRKSTDGQILKWRSIYWFEYIKSEKPLNVTTLKIKTAKYRNLISLLDFSPPLYHSCYRNLKHDAQSAASSSNTTQQVSVPDTANDEVEEDSIVLESDYE
ncbi:unnamed protein product [Psylliodes chrysocephalus]|uniref:Uncharacterized protein n=1 Tax=Psylliodes chrysocephalus TaxID=3402493 RepID=A0A9P0CL72_9CUCU|nr:unnamed protein product [Psylliodes chrysocephala]